MLGLRVRGPPVPKMPPSAVLPHRLRRLATAFRTAFAGGADGGEEPAHACSTPAPPEEVPAPLEEGAALAEARAALSDRLWGGGFLLPGGRREAERLAGLLPLSPATTLMLVGLDGGGVTGTVARQRGAWVALHAADPWLAARAAARLRPLGRRAAVELWDPAAPAFRARYHHHALVLEALRHLPDAFLLLNAVAGSLRGAGQLVMLEAVAAGSAPLPERWLALEGRLAPPPCASLVEAALQEAGFILHVAEDAGQRQAALISAGWSELLRALDRGSARAMAPAILAEAEASLLRQRLISAGALRVMRWHASLSRP
jgi:hypothetical protein